MIIDRSKKPAAKEKIKFSLPDFNRGKLANGLEFYFIEKNELPVVRLTLIINCGSRFDPILKKGLSNLLSMSIDEGAGKLNALQLANEFDMLGTHHSIYCDNDLVYLSMQSLKEHFEKSLKLFCSILTSPHLNEDDFNREKRKVITRLSQLTDEPDYLANTAFEYSLFGKNNPYAYSPIGVSGDIKNISVNDVKKFHKKYVKPGNSVLVAVGNMTNKKMVNILSKHFEDWRGRARKSAPINLNYSGRKKIYIVHKKNSVQTEVRVGHLTTKRDSKNYFPKMLLNTILGGQFSSRININLREKKGYTYGAFSRFNYLKEAGSFMISTSVGIENTKNALNEIFYELEKIKEGVTKEELDFAKSSVIKKFPANFETYRQISSNFLSKVFHNLDDNHFNDYINNVNNVTIEEINNVARKLLHPEKSITVLAGDLDKIRMQIDNEDFGKITPLKPGEFI